MDYCLGAGDGSASVWSGALDIDVDGDGALDGIGLDFDGDGVADDALADLDGDGLADHVALDVAAGDAARWFTDDGTGTWAVPADRGGLDRGTALRWFSLDGVENTGGAAADFDSDGVADLLIDVDGDGLVDRVLCGDGSGEYGHGYVDTDADGRFDVKLVDTDGDGTADAASAVSP